MFVPPVSGNTFVVLPPFTEDRTVIFGKNSDRPQNEVQEVEYIKGGFRPIKVKCTHIMIDEHPSPINSVIISKPTWMWGAKMGANDKNVVIGTESVPTRYNMEDGDGRVKRLLGMDLVRLGLERGNTAEGALDIITSLLEQHGQGGPYTENDDDYNYIKNHNSFLIADDKEAWVLETAGNFWVAEKVTNGYRNICNGLTIRTKFEKHSADIHEKAKELWLWNDETPFDFTDAFGNYGNEERKNEGAKLLLDSMVDNHFNLKKMMKLLRQKEHGICHGCDDPFPTKGSMVSRLSSSISVHYFTATPDPSMSYFKPFIFTPDVSISEYTKTTNEPQGEHYLYKVHKDYIIEKNNIKLVREIQNMERECVGDLDERLEKIEAGSTEISVLDSLMKECVEAEVTHYIDIPEGEEIHFGN